VLPPEDEPLVDPEVLPPDELPPDDELLVPHGPHVPFVLPGATLHVVPAQQSLVVVHAPPHAMHAEPEHWYEPPAVGTHGAPLQQSALEAHPPPASAHCALAQRGTPSLSCLQVSSVSQLPEQQSQVALHDIVDSLQTAPFGSQLRPASEQMPRVAPGLIWQTTFLPFDAGALGTPGPPQQSLSFVQRSPIVWQPVAGWQTRTPVGPHGAHERLQQPPPHAGTPPST
jgi:hypothetical protein